MSASAKWKVCIDREQCIGDCLCVDTAPATFELDDEQKAYVLENPGDCLEDILSAARSCPLDIITVDDAESGKRLYP